MLLGRRRGVRLHGRVSPRPASHSRQPPRWSLPAARARRCGLPSCGKDRDRAQRAAPRPARAARPGFEVCSPRWAGGRGRAGGPVGTLPLAVPSRHPGGLGRFPPRWLLRPALAQRPDSDWADSGETKRARAGNFRALYFRFPEEASLQSPKFCQRTLRLRKQGDFGIERHDVTSLPSSRALPGVGRFDSGPGNGVWRAGLGTSSSLGLGVKLQSSRHTNFPVFKSYFEETLGA